MIEVSNSDFGAILRLLDALSRTKGDSIREKEAARKATLLVKKLRRKAV